MAGITKAERERRAALKPKDAPQAAQIDLAYLHALCAALPYSGRSVDAFTPLTFEDRLEAAKANARLLLAAAGEP